MLGSALRNSLQSALRSVLKRLGIVLLVPSELPSPAALGLQDPRIARRLRDSGVVLELFSPRPADPAAAPSAAPAGAAALKWPSQQPGQGPLQLLIPTPLPTEMRTGWLDRAWDLLRVHGLQLQVITTELQASLELEASPKARRDRLEACDLVLLSCWHDDTLAALVEAAAMAKPILCIDSPEARELIQHGRDGLLVPANDVSALQLAVQLLVRQPSIAAELGLQARRKVLAAYQLAEELDQTLVTYQQLLLPKA
jgi:glycosyltransferase involved in cell wall biosynthesis